MKRRNLLILLILLIPPIVFGKSFHLKNADVSVEVLKDGVVNVNERVTFSFTGCYTEVYREIPLFSESSIINMKGYSSEEFLASENEDDDYYTYTFTFKQEQCDKETTVTLDYNMSKVVDVYNDVNALHFQFWGEDWNGLEDLNVVVKTRGEIVDYWIHNGVSGDSSESSGNLLIYNASNIPEGHWIETQVMSERFETESSHWDVHDEDAETSIRSQEFYYTVKEKVQPFFAFVILLTPLMGFYYIYNKHGKELSIDYTKGYERNPPTSDSPALVKAILNSAGNGEPNLDAFLATMFDLARRGYFKIKKGREEVNNSFLNLGESERNTIIEFEKDDVSELEDYELIVYNFLKEYEEEGRVDWNELQKELKKYDESKKFQKKLGEFKKKVSEKFEKKDYFNTKGDNAYLLLSVLILLVNTGITGLLSPDNILSIMILIFYIPFLIPFMIMRNKAKWVVLGFVLMHMISNGLIISTLLTPNALVLKAYFMSFLSLIICNGVNREVLGKWTRMGKYFELQWENFKKFLNDYSLLSKHPPESIVIWEKFLVYAVSLNVAKNVLKVMKLRVPDYPEERSMSGLYYNMAFYNSMRVNLSSASARTKSGSGSSGFGGGGGGFGGGHGGGGGGAR